MRTGKPIHGSERVADASTANEIAMFESGGVKAFTLGDNQYLSLDSLTVVSDTAADLHVFLGADGTPAAGETVARGTVGANGGFALNWLTPRTGGEGHTLWVLTDVAAQVDVNFTGTVQDV